MKDQANAEESNQCINYLVNTIILNKQAYAGIIATTKSAETSDGTTSYQLPKMINQIQTCVIITDLLSRFTKIINNNDN